jgi:hypothetical protein
MMHASRIDQCATRYDKGVRDCSQEPDRSDFLQKVASGELLVPKVTICSDNSDLDCKYGHEHESQSDPFSSATSL